mgnify:CR=1 FL=1
MIPIQDGCKVCLRGGGFIVLHQKLGKAAPVS